MLTHIETVNTNTKADILMTDVTYKFNFLIQPKKTVETVQSPQQRDYRAMSCEL